MHAAPSAEAIPSDVNLIEPLPDEKLSGAGTFVWKERLSFTLLPDQQYELIIWAPDGYPMRDGRSPVGASRDNVVKNADLTVQLFDLVLQTGKTYLWGVRLVDATGEPLRMLSEGRRFIYERPSEGGGSSPKPRK